MARNDALSAQVNNLRSEVRDNKPSLNNIKGQCWNCGSPDHQGKDCPEKIDEAKKAAFLKALSKK